MSKFSEAVRSGLDELARIRDEMHRLVDEAEQEEPAPMDVAVDRHELAGWRDTLDSVSNAIEGSWDG